MKKFAGLVTLFVFFISCRHTPPGAWTVETIPDPKKSPSKIFLTDPDTLISDGTESAINSVCWDIEQKTSVQFGMVIVKSIGTETPKQFATELFNFWEIGSKTKNNGLLLLVVLDQKRWEFETGYGLEAELTDYDCKRIGETNLVPYFQMNNYEIGLLNAAFAVQRHLYDKANQTVTNDSLFVVNAYRGSLNNQLNMDVLGVGEPPAPVSWGGFFWSLVFPSIVLYTIWGFFTYSKKKKKKISHPERKPSVFLFALFSSLTLLTYLVLFINDANMYVGWMIGGAWYVSFMFLLTDFRVRRNKEILRSQQDVYHIYSDFRKSHSLWTLFGPLFFPVIYIPYLFWYYGRCKEMRRRSRPCKKCNAQLTYKDNVISELEDDKHLNKGQIKEEYLTSRDWDVWLCKSCSATEVLGYKAYFTSYDNCPACTFITEKYLGSQTITAATYTSTGTGIKKYKCQNCNNYREVTYTIPMKTKSSSSGGGGGGGGGSSWGGGRSGGGGAGGSW